MRVLDLNIWNYNEPWAIRKDLIVSLIQDTQPDVVALQEVRYQEWRPDHRHQADQIRAGLSGYEVVWHPAAHWDQEGGGQQWEGLAILSRYPLVDQACCRLPRDADDPQNHFPRLVLGARVRAPEGHWWVFNTHFPLSDRARRRVAPLALQFLRKTSSDPFVFTGDFNAAPSELPIRFLTANVELDGSRGDLTDAWQALHPAQAGHTFPAWAPRQRIDYLFLSPNVAVQDVVVLGQVPDRGAVSPSDHCALLATLIQKVE